MADQTRQDQSEQEVQHKPSQAEGERSPGSSPDVDQPRPSQAEGSRETVEEDLEQKGLA
jgi:hypothetical protein